MRNDALQRNKANKVKRRGIWEMMQLQRNKANEQEIMRNGDIIQSKKEWKGRLKKFEGNKKESKAEESCKGGIDGFSNTERRKRDDSRQIELKIQL